MATCPECGKEFLKGTVNCKHCRANIEQADLQEAETRPSLNTSFFNNNKKWAVFIVAGLLAIVLFVSGIFLFTNILDSRLSDTGLPAVGPLKTNDSGEVTAESPLSILMAKRVMEFSDIRPSDTGEVVLVLLFSGTPDATIDNSYLTSNGKNWSFTTGYPGKMGEAPTMMFIAIVPVNILEFELNVEGHAPLTVYADEEILDEL